MEKAPYVVAFIVFLLGFDSKIAAQNQDIIISTYTNTDNSVDLLYEKKLPGSYYIGIEFSNMTNCYTNDYKTVINGSSGMVLKLRPIEPKQGIGYSFRYYYILGEPNPKIQKDFIYTLPLKKGKKVKIFEAQHLGEKYFGTEPPVNWKSYIINSNTPDTICSMRKGIVVRITNDYDSNNSNGLQYTSRRNSLVIEHPDGTFAEYTGFNKEAIFVKLGQTVYPQTQLGVIDLFNTIYRFDFSVYFLFDKNLKTNQKMTLKNYKSKYEFVTPSFITNLGVVQIEPEMEYMVDSNESVMTQEFTRSEKKKYTKEPLLFLNEKK